MKIPIKAKNNYKTSMKSNFIIRALTGTIFVLVLIAGILFGPISFSVLFALISALTVYEFGVIMRNSKTADINIKMSVLSAVFLFFGFSYLGISSNSYNILIPYIFLIMYILISELYLKKENPINNIAYALMSQLYIALPFALLNILAFQSYESDNGNVYNPILPLSIFIFTWINDTGAYCTGVLFGKHRLFERISPKKSWEGSFGGCILSIIAAIVIAQYYTILSLYEWIGLSITIVIFGTWGDLVESLIKRTIGIKDSGNILPGHGGLLDRFDSTLLAVPAAVIYLYILSII